MTIMLVAVAIGVRNDAEPAMHRLISTGRGETPMPAAAAMAIGMTSIVVAVLLMTWPRLAVSTKRPARKTMGPAPPVSVTRWSATILAAPDCTIAVESGIIAAIRITVVQLI